MLNEVGKVGDRKTLNDRVIWKKQKHDEFENN